MLLGAAFAALVVALPIGFLCVRYTGIFFGMLTLAFGARASGARGVGVEERGGVLPGVMFLPRMCQ